jgi:hypothetical protein
VQAVVGRSRSAAEKSNSGYNSRKCLIPDTYNEKEYTMKQAEVKRFDTLYARHLTVTQITGKERENDRSLFAGRSSDSQAL